MVGEDHLHADDVLVVHWCCQDTKIASVRSRTNKSRSTLQDTLNRNALAWSETVATTELLILEDGAEAGSRRPVGALVDDLAEAHALVQDGVYLLLLDDL